VLLEVEFVEEVIGWLAALHDEHRATHIRKEIGDIVGRNCAERAEEVVGIGRLDERGKPRGLRALPTGEADREQPREESPVRLCTDRQQATTHRQGTAGRGDDHGRARQNQARHPVRMSCRVAKRDRGAAVDPQRDLLEAEMVLQRE
jgi:hypothetical protein